MNSQPTRLCVTPIWANKPLHSNNPEQWAGSDSVGMTADFIAMAVIFPWLGHASWHAWRELIERA